MPKILATLILAIMLLLLVPTGLVLASQNAVPGDATYPVKRSLENAIVKIASLNPYTSAFFDINLTKRRYQEATTLIAKGHDATTTLNELISQTRSASQNVDSISDPKQKQQLIASLNQQINEYKQGLTQIEQSQKPSPQSPQNPAPLPTQTPLAVNNPAVPEQPTAVPSLAPLVTPRPTPIQSGPTPNPTQTGPTPPTLPPAPSPTPAQVVPTPRVPIGPAPSAPASALPTGSVCQPGDLQCFINQLGEIQDNLESEPQRPRQEHNQRGGSGNGRIGLPNAERDRR